MNNTIVLIDEISFEQLILLHIFNNFIKSTFLYHEIIGTRFRDLLNGTDEDDYIYGLADDDTLYGSLGHDILNGNNGYDTADYSHLGYTIVLKTSGIVEKSNNQLYFARDQLSNIESIIADPTVSNNTIDAATAPQSTSILVNLSRASLKVFSSFFKANFTVSNFDDVRGTNQNDSLIGDNQTNQFWGQGGDDYLVGLDGDDMFFGGYGIDIPTDPYIRYSWDGSDIIYGGNGNDQFYGGDGNDLIDGGNGKDIIDYNYSNYSITLLSTGIIQKRDYYDHIVASDRLYELEMIIANPFLTHNTINTVDISPDVAIYINLENQFLKEIRSLNDPLNILNFDDVKGSNQNDIIVGDRQTNFLGNDGNDYIVGLNGDDYLEGGIGNDTLLGGNGYDTLIGVNSYSTQVGYSEVDNLSSGFDALEDYFWLGDQYNSYYVDEVQAENISYAEITAFESGIDKIQLYGNSDLYVFTNSEIYYAGSDLIGIIDDGYNINTDLIFVG